MGNGIKAGPPNSYPRPLSLSQRPNTQSHDSQVLHQITASVHRMLSSQPLDNNSVRIMVKVNVVLMLHYVWWGRMRDAFAANY